MAKMLKCGEVFSGCDTVIYGKDEDEVVAKEEEHARKDHNMTMIPMDTIKDDGESHQGRRTTAAPLVRLGRGVRTRYGQREARITLASQQRDLLQAGFRDNGSP